MVRNAGSEELPDEGTGLGVNCVQHESQGCRWDGPECIPLEESQGENLGDS